MISTRDFLVFEQPDKELLVVEKKSRKTHWVGKETLNEWLLLKAGLTAAVKLKRKGE